MVVGVEARQVFDLPARRLCVAERRRYACGTTTAGRFPEHVRAAACYGPGGCAGVRYLSVHQHLPVDRAAQLLANVLGASVATGSKKPAPSSQQPSTTAKGTCGALLSLRRMGRG
ncbi:MAG TPA: hypothetical protein VFN05_06185 [Actinomycetes bacterium]|nr:hypothetical protein [Actinomycetes bacterium]